MPEKHTPFYQLLDACGMPGCPLCRLSNKASTQYIDALLYENVNDPSVRKKLNGSLGFCRRHATSLLSMGDAFGVAIIYQDIVRHIDAALMDGRELESTIECPACTIQRENSDSYSAVVMSFLHDEELTRALLRSDGFCLDHLKQCLDRAGKEGVPAWLVDLQLRKLRQRRKDLSEFVRKQDVQFKHENTTKAEDQSCESAIDFLVGTTV